VSSLVKPGDVGAEVGVWQGCFSYHTLLPRQPSKLYLIDSWAGDAESDPDRGDQSSSSQLARKHMYEQVQEAFAPYPNVEIIKMKSDEAAACFPDNFFDYVYIDGDHSYEGVMKDLESYFPKVKIGGLIIGDDYGWGRVSVAVQDFLKKYNDRIYWFGDPCVQPREGQYVIRKVR